MVDLFFKLDENEDGNITMGELGRVLKKSGKTLSTDDLKTMITAMDGNGNTNYICYLQKSPFLCPDDMNFYHATIDYHCITN